MTNNQGGERDLLETTMDDSEKVTLQSVERAARTLSGHAVVTPVHTCKTLDLMSGRRLFFKCENFQKSGAFKFRGAFNALSRLIDSNGTSGRYPPVVTLSSGNFGSGLALSARILGVPAHVIMPNTSPEFKQRAVLAHGASLTLSEPTIQDYYGNVNQVKNVTGAVYISSSQHADVVAGQGTMGLELLRQVPDLDAVVVPVGGGSMISGMSVAIKSSRPDVRVYGAEPEVADDAALSLQRGEWCPHKQLPQSVADGLNGNIGPVTWPYIRDNVDDIFTVSEDEIKNAMRLVWERMKLVVEPSGAVGVAAVLSDSFKARVAGCRNVVVVLSGGNVDLEKLPELLEI